LNGRDFILSEPNWQPLWERPAPEKCLGNLPEFIYNFSDALFFKKGGGREFSG
jgi:hypothetical protein